MVLTVILQFINHLEKYCTSYRSATRHLSQTYATDPNYATKLNSLIEHYSLTDFDKNTCLI